jgi:hypothetical protein
MAASPKHHVSERLASPATSSSTSTPSSSQSPSPIRDGKILQSEADVTKPEQRFKHTEESKSGEYDKSVALLQSLGPVQDQPIDLSVRSGTHNKTIKHRRRKSSSEDTPDEEDEVGSGSDGVVESCDDDRGEEGGNERLKERGGDSENRKPISTPLDLTTRT